MGRFREWNLVFFDVLEDLVDLKDDILTSLDGVVVWLVESIRCSIKEFHKVFRSQLGDHTVGIFRRDEEFIVAHGRRPE